RRDRIDVGTRLRVDSGERDDKADDRSDEAKQNQAVCDKANDADPVRQLQAQSGGGKGAAVTGPATNLRQVAQGERGLRPEGIELLGQIQLSARAPDLRGADGKAGNEDTDNDKRQARLVSRQRDAYPSLQIGRGEERKAREVHHSESQQQKIAINKPVPSWP